MKYGKEITVEIAGYLEKGHTRTDACTLAGISYETFTQWIKKAEFSDAIKRAEVSFKSKCIGRIEAASLSTWTAAAWLLERKYPEEFAARQKQEITLQTTREIQGAAAQMLQLIRNTIPQQYHAAVTKGIEQIIGSGEAGQR